MARALQVVRLTYVEPVEEEKLVEDAIRGMLRELDPHSVYLSAEELRQPTNRYREALKALAYSLTSSMIPLWL
jgi:carboxyl-terminal processing protease